MMICGGGGDGNSSNDDHEWKRKRSHESNKTHHRHNALNRERGNEIKPKYSRKICRTVEMIFWSMLFDAMGIHTHTPQFICIRLENAFAIGAGVTSNHYW